MSALWVGKLPASRRYNLLPLLRSGPGGFTRSWPYRTYPYNCYKIVNIRATAVTFTLQRYSFFLILQDVDIKNIVLMSIEQ